MGIGISIQYQTVNILQIIQYNTVFTGPGNWELGPNGTALAPERGERTGLGSEGTECGAEETT